MLVLGWWEKVGATRMSGIPKLLLGEAGNFPELVRFYLAEVVEPGHAVIMAIVKRGIARGEFRKVNPENAALLIAAPLLQMMLWRTALEAQSKRRWTRRSTWKRTWTCSGTAWPDDPEPSA